MQRLKDFSYIIYDANCIVYHCFFVDLQVGSATVTVTSRFTIHTRQLTDKLIANNKKVTTTQSAFDEVRECLYAAVEDRMAYREVEHQLGYAQGEHVSEQVKLKVLLSVEKHAQKLPTNSWFSVDANFIPDGNAIKTLRDFFARQNPLTLGKSKSPGQVDLELVNFGVQRQWPLVTNDRGISNSAEQLRTANLATFIYYLMDLNPA
ncbi:MAG: hypothetical protein WCH20_10705 [Nitrospira sp.]